MSNRVSLEEESLACVGAAGGVRCTGCSGKDEQSRGWRVSCFAREGLLEYIAETLDICVYSTRDAAVPFTGTIQGRPTDIQVVVRFVGSPPTQQPYNASASLVFCFVLWLV